VLSLGGSHRVFLCLRAVDFRNAHDGPRPEAPFPRPERFYSATSASYRKGLSFFSARAHWGKLPHGGFCTVQELLRKSLNPLASGRPHGAKRTGLLWRRIHGLSV